MVHIAAGGVGLIAGFTALYASKGAPLHRRAGVVFVYAVIGMCTAGATLALARGVEPALNVPAALLTGTLALTAMLTVRPENAFSRRITLATMLLTLGVGTACMRFGFEAVAGARSGMPAFPFFMFGVAGLIAAAGDARVLRSGQLRGTRRIARHLWRMSFALLVAALSFFLGQADVFPPALRIMPLLAMPVVAVLITMGYWLWRVSIRRSLRGLLDSRGYGISEAAPAAASELLMPTGPAVP